jgi:di/tricarboxylate transporter
MSWQAWFTLLVLLATVGALVRDVVSPAVAILGANILLLVTGVISTEQSLSGFSNPAPLTVAALFVLARAVEKTGALQPLLRSTLGNGGVDRRGLLRLLAPVAGASGFLNNTPIVAMLAPQVANWAEKRGRAASMFLMPLSFATILGGTITVIGTSTNLVVSGLLQAHGLPPIGMFELAAIGVPLALIGIAVIVALAPLVLPDRQTARQQFRENPREFVCQATVTAGGALDGMTIAAARLRNLEDVFLAEVERNGEVMAPVAPATVLRGGDRLTFVGRVHLMRDIQNAPGLEPEGLKHAVRLSGPSHTFFEAVVSAASGLAGHTLKEADFRSRYQAAVLAIHRAGQRINEKLGAVVLKEGDTLLLLSDPGFRDRWHDRPDFLLVSHLGGTPPPGTRKALLVGALTFAIVLLAGIGAIPILHAALVAAVHSSKPRIGGFYVAARGGRAEFERPVLLFSLAARTRSSWSASREKAFTDGRRWSSSLLPCSRCCTSIPATTSPRCSSFRDRSHGRRGVHAARWALHIDTADRRHVVQEDSIDQGRCVEETGPNASRNALQTVTLLDALKELKVDAAFGGGRRDEEKARAKERFFSHRDLFGQWDPKNQRPELWNLFNGRQGRRRAFPRVPALELDRDGRLAVHRQGAARPAVHLLHAPPRRHPPRWRAAGRYAVHRTAARRGTRRDAGPLPYRGRRDVHGRRRVRRSDARRHHPRGRRRARDRTRRPVR